MSVITRTVRTVRCYLTDCRETAEYRVVWHSYNRERIDPICRRHRTAFMDDPAVRARCRVERIPA